MTQLNLDEFLQNLAGKFPASNAPDFDSTIQFHLSGAGGGDWCMTIRNGLCEVKRGVAEKPDALLDTGVDEFVNMLTASPEEIGWAFMQGRFNLTGNIGPLWRVLAFLRELQAGP